MADESIVTVVSTVKFSCGCGWSSRQAVDAFEHALTTHHTLDASGQIGPALKVQRSNLPPVLVRA